MSEPNYIARRPKEVSKEDKDFLEWVDCWQCWGEGMIADCWEEFACIDPESGCDGCRYKCDICHGDGGWYLEEVQPDPTPDDHLKEPPFCAKCGGTCQCEDWKDEHI